MPEYDLVHLRVISKRSADDGGDSASYKRVHLNAFGEKLQLRLQPNSEFDGRLKSMKVISAETTSNGKLKYVEEPVSGDADQIGAAYHDDRHMAAVLLRHGDDGHLQMDGTIGNHLVIKPVPASLVVEDTSARDDDEMFLDDELETGATGTRVNSAVSKQLRNLTTTITSSTTTPATYNNREPNTNIPKLFSDKAAAKQQPKQRSSSLYHKSAHFVFKRKLHEDAPHTDYLELEPGHAGRAATLGHIATAWTNHSSFDHNHNVYNNHSDHQRAHRRSKRQSPDTVWPEVLLVVDYDSYLLHGGNSRDVKRYFISFWNGVDLRYKLLSHPRIRVSLAGMIVAKVSLRLLRLVAR